MDKNDKNMDAFCAILGRVADWIDRSELPEIPYAGFSMTGFRNPPAPHLEIAYIRKGSVPDLRLGRKSVRFPEGALSIHNVHFGNYSHPAVNNLESWCLFLDVDGVKAFKDLAKAPMFHAIEIGPAPTLVAAFDELIVQCLLPGRPASQYPTGPKAYVPGEQVGSSNAERLRIKGALLGLLAVMLDLAKDATADPATRLPGPVRSATEHMRRNYMKADLALPEIAQASGLSVDHFGRIFRGTMDVTPMEYLRRVRMDRAQRLLVQTDLRVREVAAETGFADPLHFSRIFRQFTGQNPRLFRNASRGKDEG